MVLFDPQNIRRSTLRDEAYDLVDEVEEMAAVLDAAGLRRVWISGRSRGGMLAQEFALQHPDRTEGLVLEATTDNGPRHVGPHERVQMAMELVPGLSREEIFARQTEAMAAPGLRERDPDAFARLLSIDLEAPPRRFAVPPST